MQIEEFISNHTLILFGIYVNAGTRSSSAACAEKRHDLYLRAFYKLLYQLVSARELVVLDREQCDPTKRHRS